MLWSKEGFGVGHYVPIIEFVKEGEDEIEVLKNAVKVGRLHGQLRVVELEAHNLSI